METQSLVVAAILLGALAFVGRRAVAAVRGIKRAKDDPGCGSDCGCGTGA